MENYIKDESVISFLNILQHKIDNLTEFDPLSNNSILLWEDAYFYEKISEDEELAHDIKKIIKHELFKDFSYILEVNDNKIYLRHINRFKNEYDILQKILKYIKIIHHDHNNNQVRKMSINMDGELLSCPNRRYVLNFINNYEYVVHVYDKNIDTMLFYIFIPI